MSGSGQGVRMLRWVRGRNSPTIQAVRMAAPTDRAAASKQHKQRNKRAHVGGLTINERKTPITGRSAAH